MGNSQPSKNLIKNYSNLKYRGRFAPAPSGPLHFGSLIAALGSFLQARNQNGQWILRIEDIDIPRVQPGAADNILRTLDKLGMHWDEKVITQSHRHTAYHEALERLKDLDLVYYCACTRKETKGQRYPGTCRGGLPENKKRRSIRIQTDRHPVTFVDRIQGKVEQTLETEIGDFIIRRADNITAYHLAVVVDDAYQGITEIVRGADLLDSTPRQIYLQRFLDFATPEYCHLPVAINKAGKKISKQNHAPAIALNRPVSVLYEALIFLGQHPDPLLLHGTPEEIINWGIENWHLEDVPQQREIQINSHNQ